MLGRRDGAISRAVLGVLALGLTLALGIAIPAQAAKYYEVNHDIANREWGHATGINSTGDVVMTTNRWGGNNWYPTLYSKGTVTTISRYLDCPDDDGSVHGCPGTDAVGVNGNLQVTGTAGWENGDKFYPYRYDVKTGAVHYLPTLGGGDFAATAINGAGEVVGWSLTPSGAKHAFLWNGSFTKDLGTLGGSSSEARSTYATGQAVGCSTISSGRMHPFLYQGGVMRDLGLPSGQPNGCATSINAGGVIVGNSGTRAWIKRSSGFALIPMPSGAVSMDAEHIANNGEVVGQYSTGDRSYGYVYSGGKVTTLNKAIPFDDYDIAEAAANNLKGQIAATTQADWLGDPLLLTPITVRDEMASSLTYTGYWTRIASALAFGGFVRLDDSGTGSVTMRFTGRDVSVIGPLSVNGGSATVYLDGVKVGIANENASVASPRQRLFTQEWASVGNHTLRLVTIQGPFKLDAITFAPK